MTQTTDLFDQLAERVAEIVLARLPKPAAPEQDGFMRIPQAAEFLGLSVSAVRMATKRGELPCHRVGKRVLFDRGELREFVRSGPAA
jgi:excisionase family DNA binding protein